MCLHLFDLDCHMFKQIEKSKELIHVRGIFQLFVVLLGPGRASAARSSATKMIEQELIKRNSTKVIGEFDLEKGP